MVSQESIQPLSSWSTAEQTNRTVLVRLSLFQEKLFRALSGAQTPSAAAPKIKTTGSSACMESAEQSSFMWSLRGLGSFDSSCSQRFSSSILLPKCPMMWVRIHVLKSG